jgi:hypothetical protein
MTLFFKLKLSLSFHTKRVSYIDRVLLGANLSMVFCWQMQYELDRFAVQTKLCARADLTSTMAGQLSPRNRA